MNKAVERFLAKRVVLSLASSARTRSGIEFDPANALWRFRDGITQVSINFALLPDTCMALLPGLKKTLIWFLENRSPGYANSAFAHFLWLVRQLLIEGRERIERIEPEDIAVLKLMSENAEHHLAAIRGFLIKWVELGVSGIEPKVANMLDGLTLKQSPVGVAVATLDPEKGPLSDLEFEAIQAALNDSYARDEIDTEQLLLCYLLMSLGVRPVQLAMLKCCDLIVPESPDGDYVLKVPRAKQSGQFVRSEFKWRKLTHQIGEPLAAHMKGVQSEFADRLEDVSDAPLFPQRWLVENADSPGFKYHACAPALSQRIANIFTKLRVPSERLEQGIPVSAIRFRRTFATRAAEEGWPLLVIAELMDHTNTKNVEVYAGLTSRIRAQFSRKIAMDMAPLAMAFAGKIIHKEEEARRPYQATRIVDLRIDRSGATMGSCGSHVSCDFARPIACYGGCYEFEPWLDGPHEAALDYMLARREYLMNTTDPRVAVINDRAILGCAQVILRCRQILAEEKNE